MCKLHEQIMSLKDSELTSHLVSEKLGIENTIASRALRRLKELDKLDRSWNGSFYIYRKSTIAINNHYLKKGLVVR